MTIFKKKRSVKRTIEELILEESAKLEKAEPSTDEYWAIYNRLEALIKLQGTAGPKFKISPDVLLTVGGNLLGILLVLNYEKLGYISSKAFSMIVKPRI